METDLYEDRVSTLNFIHDTARKVNKPTQHNHGEKRQQDITYIDSVLQECTITNRY